MSDLMSRRRALMGEKGGGVIPDGYITNGLVFMLDGKQLASASAWTDIVGGKTFDLINCSKSVNGIAFDGATSYGKRNGAITRDWAHETIEVVLSSVGNAMNSGGTVPTVFCQPYDEHDGLGISLRFGYNGPIRTAIGLDGVERLVLQFIYTTSVTMQRIGVNASNLIYDGVTSNKNGGRTSYVKNTSGYTILGARVTSDQDSPSGLLNGTINSIRVYNRILTDAEIKANQAVDAVYYA